MCLLRQPDRAGPVPPAGSGGRRGEPGEPVGDRPCQRPRRAGDVGRGGSQDRLRHVAPPSRRVVPPVGGRLRRRSPPAVATVLGGGSAVGPAHGAGDAGAGCDVERTGPVPPRHPGRVVGGMAVPRGRRQAAAARHDEHGHAHLDGLARRLRVFDLDPLHPGDAVLRDGGDDRHPHHPGPGARGPGQGPGDGRHPAARRARRGRRPAFRAGRGRRGSWSTARRA